MFEGMKHLAVVLVPGQSPISVMIIPCLIEHGVDQQAAGQRLIKFLRETDPVAPEANGELYQFAPWDLVFLREVKKTDLVRITDHGCRLEPVTYQK